MLFKMLICKLRYSAERKAHEYDNFFIIATRDRRIDVDQLMPLHIYRANYVRSVDFILLWLLWQRCEPQ